MKDNAPAFYHHFINKDGSSSERVLLRQDANRVRAQSREAYRIDPVKAKAINAVWQREHPELRRESVSIWWQRNKHRPEIQEANRLKARRLYARRRVYRSLRIT